MSLLKARPRLVAAALLAMVVVLAIALLPADRLLLELQAWAATAGPVAPLLVTGLLAVGILLMLPFSPLMMLAGFLFGPLLGLAVVWTAGLLASAAAFWIGRRLARPWIERRIRHNGTFLAIDRAIRRKAFLVVLLTRLVMLLPYPALNYSLGLTSVGMLPYLAGTNLGMIGPMFLFVYLGASAANLAAILAGEVQLGRDELAFALAGVAAVVTVVLLIIRSAARVLKEELAAAGAPPAAPPAR